MDANSWLGKLSGSGAEAKQRAEEDAAQRKAEGQRKGSIILTQKDIITEQWDSHKVLYTTLGLRPGENARAITADDLAAFRRNIDAVKNKVKKGVSAKQIIDWSKGIAWGTKSSDLSLAIEQIKMAVPVSGSNGRVRFITNAGPDSDVSRHHVTIQFMNYGAEAASGAKDARKSALRLRQGPLSIECDCGKFRFWYRYIATIGGFNAGRAETGMPKIRNPKLSGIACKHIVRVASEIQSGPATLNFLIKLMDKAKSSDEAKAAVRHKQEAAEKIIKNQAKRTTGSNIKTSEQKRNDRMAKAAINAAKQAKPMVKPPSGTRRAETLSGLVAGYKANGFTRKQLEFMDKSGTLKTPKGITKQQLFDAFGD